MSIETANALRVAKARIDTPGKWCKHQGDNGRGALCAFGAIWGMPVAVLRALRAEVNRTIGGTCDSDYVSLASFNDAPTTTHADIMALFDRAIAAEEAKP
jgi:hypothetical protein